MPLVLAFGKHVAEPGLQFAVPETKQTEVQCTEDLLVHNPKIEMFQSSQLHIQIVF